MNNFSYKEYIKIIKFLTETRDLPLVDYADITEQTKCFCILRHDVEYSPERALQLASLESDVLKIKSSYFFQIRNNAYNLFSDKNIDIVNEIASLGHKIGLHVHHGARKQKTIEDYISEDIKLMESVLGLEIDRYAHHRPTKEIFLEKADIPGKINAYGKKYFHFFSGVKPNKLNVIYMSDSNHCWKFGTPLDVAPSEKKVYVLTHPFSWTREGYNNFDNFKLLVEEKNKESIISINNEIKTFPHELLKRVL